MTSVKGWHTGKSVVYDPLSLATDSCYYVFFFITLYKNPYLGLVKILSGGWDNIFAGTSYSN